VSLATRASHQNREEFGDPEMTLYTWSTFFALFYFVYFSWKKIALYFGANNTL
jgi:hypothetical protein